MLYTNIREASKILGVDPDSAACDLLLLNWYIEFATDIINTYLNRDLELKYRTEYYNGSGIDKLLLRSRPVFPSIGTANEIKVYQAERKHFDESPNDQFDNNNLLIYGRDYLLDLDTDNGSSKSGILVNLNGWWPRPRVRDSGWLTPYAGTAWGTVKVQYYAGYTEDTLPPAIRMSANILVASIRSSLPLGKAVGAESYEERSVSLIEERRDYLTAIVKPFLIPYRNWKF